MTPSMEFSSTSADATLTAPRSFLRIAIPSWRFVGIHIEPDAEPVTLSKEELQTLFRGELSSRSKKRVLTENEEQEQSVADRIRRALYPQFASY
ncbi:MAG: hypothetical protein WBB85_23050 [Albidovulum sp.]|uniref:hypothetical protein n=1 Tax=Albidovulum sp. TaxID=1872424 RepID=UPI003C99BBF3